MRIKMNRAARRRKQKELEKVKKPPTYNLSQAQLQAIIMEDLRKAQHDAMNYAVKGLTAAFVISLHDEFEFGPKRLQRLLDKANLQFECIDAGTVTVEDLIEWCKDYGVNIK